MNPPTPALDALPFVPRDPDGPVFREPWEARAFALAVRLSDAGWFPWSAWVATLSQEIHAAQAQGDPDLGQTYYQHWLRALERLCAAQGLVSPDALAQRTDAWRHAYAHTPHGQPVHLSAAESAPP